ncbi:MAG: TIGR04282 family arsenosugar biosynthesis glycosyltransferase, partial [Bacteroidota bacterium]
WWIVWYATSWSRCLGSRPAGFVRKMVCDTPDRIICPEWLWFSDGLVIVNFLHLFWLYGKWLRTPNVGCSCRIYFCGVFGLARNRQEKKTTWRVRETLIIFAKNPELGKVKTRLAYTVGDEKALAIYKRLLEHTKAVSLPLPVNKKVYFTKIPSDSNYWGEPFGHKTQAKGELGDKLKRALSDELTKSEKVCLIGTDCAELSTEILLTSFESLNNHDLVIGPARDGGYYLIGMKQYHKSLFEEIKWSTKVVFEQTVDKANALGLTVYELPKLSDIDTEEDWKNSSLHGKL